MPKAPANRKTALMSSADQSDLLHTFRANAFISFSLFELHVAVIDASDSILPEYTT